MLLSRPLCTFVSFVVNPAKKAEIMTIPALSWLVARIKLLKWIQVASP